MKGKVVLTLLLLSTVLISGCVQDGDATKYDLRCDYLEDVLEADTDLRVSCESARGMANCDCWCTFYEMTDGFGQEVDMQCYTDFEGVDG